MNSFDIQGHRGCRGLLPENTIPAFIKALELGVKTLEMDVVITADSQVVVSHEPFLSHEICSDTNGNRIPSTSEKTFNIYHMSYADLQQYDCGSLKHPRFPKQEKLVAKKPLLKAVISASEAYAKENELPLPFYNIETKSTPQGDGIYHPKPAEFTQLLLDVIAETGISDRFILQSFDPRTLEYAHQKDTSIKCALLVENTESVQANLNRLTFKPSIYSCDFNLLTEEDVQFLHRINIQVIPWTVNEESEMNNLLDLGVDGIISDYPDVLINVVSQRKS